MVEVSSRVIVKSGITTCNQDECCGRYFPGAPYDNVWCVTKKQRNRENMNLLMNHHPHEGDVSGSPDKSKT